MTGEYDTLIEAARKCAWLGINAFCDPGSLGRDPAARRFLQIATDALDVIEAMGHPRSLQQDSAALPPTPAPVRCWRAATGAFDDIVDRQRWNGEFMEDVHADGTAHRCASWRTLADAEDLARKGLWVECPDSPYIAPVASAPSLTSDAMQAEGTKAVPRPTCEHLQIWFNASMLAYECYDCFMIRPENSTVWQRRSPKSAPTQPAPPATPPESAEAVAERIAKEFPRDDDRAERVAQVVCIILADRAAQSAALRAEVERLNNRIEAAETNGPHSRQVLMESLNKARDHEAELLRQIARLTTAGAAGVEPETGATAWLEDARRHHEEAQRMSNTNAVEPLTLAVGCIIAALADKGVGDGK